MRSVFAYLRDTTIDEVATFLDRTCPSQIGPPWIWESQGDVSLYIRCESGMAANNDLEDGDSILVALGAPPTVTVIADVSGRHSGDDEVRGLLSELLRSFRGVACDDYTSHAWALEEVLSGHKVNGHPFFDYQGWHEANARK